ncbi:protein ACCELERATED CELL DEATH 6-like [Prunus yedoensis var. nudiflora]|uniref:Protein ACCELERATED CELL DEATH 6-like n=1 Tax=Prunus yedoensis var. nudiflora TaxID=2094558 RepID=A0A314UXA7_PRUYE|nr:protein ACCELERATED CELL DEATH 6-like [Prunus yedoensis var. nudiflora]
MVMIYLRLYQQLYSYATHGNTNGFHDTIEKKLQDPNARVQLLSRRSPQNNTFVHIAVSSGHAELAAEILQQHKPLLLEKNFEGDTALHIAAKSRDIVTTTNTLLREARGTTDVENNGDILTLLRMKNNEENTALHEALIQVTNQYQVFDRGRFLPFHFTLTRNKVPFVSGR